MANYLQAIKTKLTGERDIQVSDLEVYLTSRVAIGEHPDIGAEIEAKIKKIDEIQSQIETIDKLFAPDEPEEQVLTEETEEN